MISKAAQGLANKLFGHAAEERAAKFLRKKGFKIVALNWACKRGELDIIALKDGVLHFCEVKSSARGYAAEEYLRPGKIEKIQRAIAVFFEQNPHLRGDFCVDLLAISGADVRHLENITGW